MAGFKKIIIQVFFLVVAVSLISSCGKRYSFEKKKRSAADSIEQISYENYWDALRNFDFEYLDTTASAGYEKDLLLAAKFIEDHDLFRAENKLKDIFRYAQDSALRENSLHLLTETLFFKNKWDELLSYDSLVGSKREQKANEMLLAVEFRKFEPTRIEYELDSAEIEMETGPTGVPVIEVEINGSKRKFWFDTGANYTFLTAKTAEGCGVKFLSPKATKAITSTKREIYIRPGFARKISFGKIHSYNNPVVIVMEEDLKFESEKSGELVQIDGIIGWKTMQNFAAELDFINDRLILRKDTGKFVPNKNFFWSGVPIVKVEHVSGRKLNFFFDTGSEETRITRNLFKKISFEEIFSHAEMLGTAGGWVYNDRKSVAELEIYVGDYLYNFRFIGSVPPIDRNYLVIDGYIGNEILKNSVVNYSLKSGVFKISYPEGF